MTADALAELRKIVDLHAQREVPISGGYIASQDGPKQIPATYASYCQPCHGNWEMGRWPCPTYVSAKAALDALSAPMSSADTPTPEPVAYLYVGKTHGQRHLTEHRLDELDREVRDETPLYASPGVTGDALSERVLDRGIKTAGPPWVFRHPDGTYTAMARGAVDIGRFVDETGAMECEVVAGISPIGGDSA